MARTLDTPTLVDVSRPSRTAWDRCWTNDPDAMPTQAADWFDALSDVGGWRADHRLYRFADGRELVLPLVRRARGALSIHASPPDAWGFGGLVGAAYTAADVGLVLDHLGHHTALGVRIRPNPLHADAWYEAAAGRALTVERRAHVIDLRDLNPAGPPSRSARRNIRKAEKAGVVVRLSCGGSHLETLFELTALATERWAAAQNEPVLLSRLRGAQKDPAGKLATIGRHLGPAFRLYTAELDGRTVAANLVLVGHNAHATRGALDPDLGRSSGAGHLLDWRAMTDAHNDGCAVYHLGESGTSSGLGSYKESLGAVAHAYPEVRIERLPLTRIDHAMRSGVKRLIGFRDAT